MQPHELLKCNLEFDCYIVRWFNHTYHEQVFDIAEEAVLFARKLVDKGYEFVRISKIMNVTGWY